MKHIVKDSAQSVVVRHEAELQTKQLDRISLLARKSAGEEIRSSELYRQIRSREVIPHFYDLLDLLNEEQGGICCYCGSKLRYPDTRHYSVEHVKPRSKYVELVGEYENLLLSCHMSEEEHQDVLEEVASMGLRRKRDKSAAAMNRTHCDEHKSNAEIAVSPLDTDCADHFIYKSDGTVVANSPEGERTIDSLNLNCQSLVKLRAKAIYTLVYAEECDLYALSQKIMDRKSDGTLPEFCFVIRSVIENMLKE